MTILALTIQPMTILALTIQPMTILALSIQPMAILALTIQPILSSHAAAILDWKRVAESQWPRGTDNTANGHPGTDNTANDHPGTDNTANDHPGTDNTTNGHPGSVNTANDHPQYQNATSPVIDLTTLDSNESLQSYPHATCLSSSITRQHYEDIDIPGVMRSPITKKDVKVRAISSDFTEDTRTKVLPVLQQEQERGRIKSLQATPFK
ncbi:hypothetical protein QZH41_002263 [Actinostola sp. cb2023]|nr:hypothetical protein QZH41_002263 [Actinostola sp. cb2023]